jgi:nardilysin
MVFLGSEKYPQENEFDSFVSSHGGYSNAYTENDCTTYYFDVENEHLEKSIDIFAQMFIKPIISSDAVE